MAICGAIETETNLISARSTLEDRGTSRKDGAMANLSRDFETGFESSGTVEELFLSNLNGTERRSLPVCDCQFCLGSGSIS